MKRNDHISKVTPPLVDQQQISRMSLLGIFLDGKERRPVEAALFDIEHHLAQKKLGCSISCFPRPIAMS
jgi:hypothetical protein